MTLDAAIEVFVHAFSKGKSFTSPHILERKDDLWVLHDPPERRNPRKTEVVSCGLGAAETVRRIQKAELGWHFVCDVHAVDADFGEIRRNYKSLGYRALSTEWLFVHDLETIPVLDSEPPVKLVRSVEELRLVNQRASQRRKLHPGWRLYGIWDKERDYGWVESAPVGENAWVSGLHVHGDQRGRGFGRALMSKLLLDDKALGVKSSVLLASSDGARLYPHLRYEKIAVLQMFCPSRRK